MTNALAHLVQYFTISELRNISCHIALLINTLDCLKIYWFVNKIFRLPIGAVLEAGPQGPWPLLKSDWPLFNQSSTRRATGENSHKYYRCNSTPKQLAALATVMCVDATWEKQQRSWRLKLTAKCAIGFGLSDTSTFSYVIPVGGRKNPYIQVNSW